MNNSFIILYLTEKYKIISFEKGTGINGFKNYDSIQELE